jgi:hypothetical protein
MKFLDWFFIVLLSLGVILGIAAVAGSPTTSDDYHKESNIFCHSSYGWWGKIEDVEKCYQLTEIQK